MALSHVLLSAYSPRNHRSVFDVRIVKSFRWRKLANGASSYSNHSNMVKVTYAILWSVAYHARNAHLSVGPIRFWIFESCSRKSRGKDKKGFSLFISLVSRFRISRYLRVPCMFLAVLPSISNLMGRKLHSTNFRTILNNVQNSEKVAGTLSTELSCYPLCSLLWSLQC